MSGTKAEIKVDIRYLGSIADKNSKEAQAIKEIIIACDNDFIPPLTFRGDAKAPIKEQELHESDVTPYLTQVLAQENIVALNEESEIVAFMSFKNKYPHTENFPGVYKDGDVVNYISTICVLEEYRRFGITRRFYELMEESLPKSVWGECVSTRTWSTNDGHLRLLEKRGYTLTHTIPEDRVTETGEKLDTVYYCKRLPLANN